MKKIISYNINGIRAAMNKGLLEWLETENPDIIGFQEIKANTDQFDVSKFEDLGYHCYWFSAEKKGYSGVAALTKEKPKKVFYGADILDNEGRYLQLDFDDFSFISLYVPSGTNMDRLETKMQFCYDLEKHMKLVLREQKNLIISGDYNICHEAIDIHDPVRNKKVSGFLPIERAWLDGFMNSGFVDSFRLLNPEPNRYSWWSYRANSRANNKGWRIDYQLVSQNLKDKIIESDILDKVVHSDHCPISFKIDI